MHVLVFTKLFPSPGWPTQRIYHVNPVKALSEFSNVFSRPDDWGLSLRLGALRLPTT
jgi:hypothetical protein